MKFILTLTLLFFQLLTVSATQHTDATEHILQAKTEHEKIVQNQFNLLKAVAKLLDPAIPAENLESLEALNSYAQANWLRALDKERKDIAPESMDIYSPKTKEEIKHILTQLGFINQIHPLNKPDMIIILGATVQSMEKRIQYAVEMINQLKWHDCKVILLTGDRPLFEDTEINSGFFDKEYWKEKTMPKTESDAAAMIWQKNSNSPYTLLATPMLPSNIANGSMRRPTTNDTINTLLATLTPGKYNVLFISHNPYIQYQAETIKALLIKGTIQSKFIFSHTAGARANFEEENPKEVKDNLARYIYSILQTKKAIKNALTYFKEQTALQQNHHATAQYA